MANNSRRQRRPRRQRNSAGLAKTLGTILRSVQNPARAISNARVGTAALPAAYSTHVKSWYKTRNVGKNLLRVSGCDLVYRIPGQLAAQTGAAFCCIPSNPAYWQGTRIASLAATYSNFRPVRMAFHYVPQVSVNQTGTVVMGTLWNQGSPSQSLQQTLLTSNGGLMCQCYVPADTRVDLARSLPQNNFYMSGVFSRDTNPFVFMAVVQGADLIPGYFFVSYSYDFWNPVGENWSYSTRGPARLDTIAPSDNTSVVLLQSDSASGLGPGTVLTRSAQQWLNNGVPVALSPVTQVYAYLSRQGGAYLPNITDPLQTQVYDTIDITAGSPTSPDAAKPLVSRTPGTQYTTNELNLWTAIRGAAGRFARNVLVPYGKGMLLTLLNPDTRKGAQIALNEDFIPPQETGVSRMGGYSKLSFSALAQSVRDRLSHFLGGDITQMRNLLTHVKAIASVAAPSRGVGEGDGLDDDVQGFAQATAQEGENVVSRPGDATSYTWDPNTDTELYYFTPNGDRVAIGSPATKTYLRKFASLPNTIQQSFISPIEYVGDLPPTAQEFTPEQYDRAIDEMVAHGVSSVDGQTVVGAGVIGDFADSLDVTADVSPVINNYAANSLTVNNEYSVDLSAIAKLASDPYQMEAGVRHVRDHPDATPDQIRAVLPPVDPFFYRTYVA